MHCSVMVSDPTTASAGICSFASCGALLVGKKLASSLIRLARLCSSFDLRASKLTQHCSFAVRRSCQELRAASYASVSRMCDLKRQQIP